MRCLIDEMLPPAVAAELNRRGHDATHVSDAGLAGQPDRLVFDAAVAQRRIVVTENVADFAALVDHAVRNDEPAVAVVFVRKADLPRRGALAAHLAERLDRWADANPDPYLGPHWP